MIAGRFLCDNLLKIPLPQRIRPAALLAPVARESRECQHPLFPRRNPPCPAMRDDNQVPTLSGISQKHQHIFKCCQSLGHCIFEVSQLRKTDQGKIRMPRKRGKRFLVMRSNGGRHATAELQIYNWHATPEDSPRPLELREKSLGRDPGLINPASGIPAKIRLVGGGGPVTKMNKKYCEAPYTTVRIN